MKRIDRLVLGEMIGPWFFGVAIFTVIIMAGTYLFQLTNYFVSGIPATQIFAYTGLLLPGIMVKTFAMAVLLAALLSFGRLSGDSEVVALKASGAGIPRIMVPVALFGCVVAILYFATDELIVAPAALKAEAIKDQIAKHLTGLGNRISIGIPGPQGKEVAALSAKDFDPSGQVLTDVVIVFYDKTGRANTVLLAHTLKFTGASGSLGNAIAEDWELAPGGVEITVFPHHYSSLGRTYPANLPAPPKPQDILAVQLKNLDALNMPQTKESIEKLELDPKVNKGQIANLWYGYYNKVSLPLATIVFALVGAPLGIRGHRTGTATGFALSVVIIFAYLMLSNWMSIYSTGQRIPPYAASFAPIVIGMACAAVLIYKRNLS